MPKLTEKQIAKLDTLKGLPDDQIDTSDIPEKPVNPAKAIRGAFYQPVKHPVTIHLDDYVIQWFKENTDTKQDYQEVINQVLMEHIQRQRVSARKAIAKPASSESHS